MMAPRRGWACCLRPQVAEHDQGSDAVNISPRKEVTGQQNKAIEDSANADGFAKLRCSTVPAVAPVDDTADAEEDFASPASSYVTCFSEEDPAEPTSW